MDVAPEELRRSGDAAGGEGAAGEGAEVAPARPLEQEPLLAARIMIEDCMCLILDVLDIDQIFVAASSAGGWVGARVGGCAGGWVGGWVRVSVDGCRRGPCARCSTGGAGGYRQCPAAA